MNMHEEPIDNELIDFVSEVGIKALIRSNEIHNELGDEGTVLLTTKNQFNELPYKGDREAEKGMIQIVEKSGLSGMVDSEEHGAFYIGEENNKSWYIFDGMDIYLMAWMDQLNIKRVEEHLDMVQCLVY
jgi:hypothetical protein